MAGAITRLGRAGRIFILLPAFSCPGLHAQVFEPAIAVILLMGEWHFGTTTVPSGLAETARDGRQRALGVALPLSLSPSWQLRPRYDDGRFSGSQDYRSAFGSATAETLVKQRHGGMDLIYSPQGDRWSMTRPTVYVGVGVGLMQTWHERQVNGYLVIPGLPPGASEQSWSPAGRIFLGLQVHPAVALEAQFQRSTHQFEGARYDDTCGTVGLRVWPAVLFGKLHQARRN